MLEKRTAFSVRSLAMDQPLLHSTTSPAPLPPVTRFHPSASHLARRQSCLEPRRQPAPFLFLAAWAWLLHCLLAHTWIMLLLLLLVVQFIRAPWGVTLLLPPQWPHHLLWCSHRVTTRTDTPPPAAEPVLIFQLQKSCHRVTHLNRTRIPWALSHRHSRCQGPPLQR